MSTAVKHAPNPKTIAPKEVSPEDAAPKVTPPADLWDQYALAALSGTASEVRLTAAEVARKAANCADRMVEMWTDHYNPPVPPVLPGDLATVQISPTSDSVAATPETSSFAVTITDPGSWTAVSNATSWLSVVSPIDPQTVDGDVTYATTANTGTTRTGTITVNARTFTVVQSAGA